MTTQIRFPQGPVSDLTTGIISLEWQQWLQNPQFVTVTISEPLGTASGGTGSDTAVQEEIQMAGPFYPANVDSTAQVVSAIWAGNGVPDNAYGANGHYYFRADGTVGSNIYKKTAGLWGAIL